MTFDWKLKTLAVCLPAFALLPSQVAAQNARPAGAGPRPVVTVGSQGPMPEHTSYTPAQSAAGGGLFLQNCAFCHGKEAGGGESGPDLTRSKLVLSDKDGEAIAPVIRNGRPEKGMPRFNLPEGDVTSLIAFIHTQQDKLMSQTGTRKGVEDSDLLTGDAAAGKRYFEGEGGCAKCHTATSLGGVATRLTGLRLEEQMLYPRDVKAKVSVKDAAGQSFSGTLAYRDEFTIGLKDGSNTYRSWPTRAVTFQVDNPVEAHVAAFSKYTDEAIHNLFAYVQTLK